MDNDEKTKGKQADKQADKQPDKEPNKEQEPDKPKRAPGMAMLLYRGPSEVLEVGEYSFPRNTPTEAPAKLIKTLIGTGHELELMTEE